MKRKSPRKHTVRPKDKRFNVKSFTRGKGGAKSQNIKRRTKLHPYEKKILKKFETLTNEALKKQVQDGLAEQFDMLGAKAVAREIRAGRNVTGNAEFGFRMSVHGKVAPRVDIKTYKFIPQTKRGRELEEKYMKTMNQALKSGGFKEMSPNILSDLRKKDKAFEKKIRKRRAEFLKKKSKV